MVFRLFRFQNALELGIAFDYFPCVRTRGVDLQSVLARILDRRLYEVLSDTFTAKLFVDLGVIDGHRVAVFEISELGDPLAILIDIESTLPPMLVSLNLHHSSITTDGPELFHRFARRRR